jgi:hypothetical protein
MGAEQSVASEDTWRGEPAASSERWRCGGASQQLRALEVSVRGAARSAVQNSRKPRVRGATRLVVHDDEPHMLHGEDHRVVAN